jgi:hypothetical protein
MKKDMENKFFGLIESLLTGLNQVKGIDDTFNRRNV